MADTRDKITTLSFKQMKKKGKKIVWLTAYDYYTARALDDAGVDGLLVGDSLGMVVYGKKDTLSVTMEMMLPHTEAVSRAVSHAFVVGDMPFMSYQTSDADAIRNAGRFLSDGGATGVKLEGGIEMAARIHRITEIGIPVMGHIGLTPQSINKFGGYKVQGKTDKAKNYLLESALALQEAGCFGMVLEAIKSDIAQKISQSLEIPTFGIGAGSHTDGQIIVTNDIVGASGDFQPKFVRRYFDLGAKLREVASQFAADVRNGSYPNESESYG